MKINNAIIIFTLAVLSTGCFAPINSVFESAKMLEDGEIDLQGSYSTYYTTFDDDDFSSGNTNNNIGVGVGYGVSDKVNMKLRYERINIKAQKFTFLDDEIGGGNSHLNYFELSGKFQLKQDKIAFSLPLGLYTQQLDESALFVLDPRFIFTFSKNDKFEFNVIPKAHIFIGDGVGIMPGLNLGLAFSNDLNKWAIRPEIGYDFYFTFGVGVNYYLDSNKGR